MPKGIQLSLDIKTLIEEVKLAPAADENFKRLIQNILKEAEINAPVTTSVI
jgi:hypothetical protein